MKLAEYLKTLKPAETSIVVDCLVVEIFKTDCESERYSARIYCGGIYTYYTNRFEYIKYYDFRYLIKKLIKDYGHLEYKV